MTSHLLPIARVIYSPHTLSIISINIWLTLGEVEGDGGQRRAIEVYMLEVYWLEIDRAYNCQ